MTPPVKLRANLPDDRHNGLYDPEMVTGFLSSPMNAVLVIGIVYSPNTDSDNERGIAVPVVRFKHIEAVSDPKLRSQAAHILHQLHEQRTGEMALPFEPDQDIPRPGEGDPYTGDGIGEAS